jgi:EAL domain-containing protein (putative c-di-GMP-specific phosphodiesterase class I)
MGVELGQGYLLGRPTLIDAAWGEGAISDDHP